MVVAEDIKNAVMKLASEHGGKSFRLADVARMVSPNNWEDLLDQVRLVVDAMVKEGKIQTFQRSNKLQSFKKREP